jgi:predicted esterase
MSTDLGFIHRFERGGNPEAPTVLALHGTGGTESDLIPIAQTLFPGAHILSPRGKVLENGMPRFFRRIAEGVFDIEDLHRRTEELAEFIIRASNEYDIPAPVWAIGFSNGANIAASLLLSRPDVIQGAVLLRAMLPFNPKQPPQLAGIPVFLAAGQMDPLVPVDNVEGLATLLRNSGADVTLNFVPAGHNLVREELDAIAQWVNVKTA